MLRTRLLASLFAAAAVLLSCLPARAAIDVEASPPSPPRLAAMWQGAQVDLVHAGADRSALAAQQASPDLLISGRGGCRVRGGGRRPTRALGARAPAGGGRGPAGALALSRHRRPLADPCPSRPRLRRLGACLRSRGVLQSRRRPLFDRLDLPGLD